MNTDKTTATVLANKIKLKSEVNQFVTQTKNRIFDAVINLNMMQDKPVILDTSINVVKADDEMLYEKSKETSGGIMNSIVNFIAGGATQRRPMMMAQNKRMSKKVGGKTHGGLSQSYQDDEE